MTDRNYALRLAGLPLPDGQLRFGDLAAIASGLQALTSRIARQLTGKDGPGRSPAVVEAVSALRCTGLAGGSTVLAFELGDPAAPPVPEGLGERVAARFDEVVASLAGGAAPAWVTPGVGEAVLELLTSLTNTGAEAVGVERDGAVLVRVAVAELDGGPWRPPRQRTHRPATVSGVLFAVDVRARRFRIADDVGNDIALTEVEHPADAAQLVTTRVSAEGTAEYDESGQLRRLSCVTVRAADLPSQWRAPLPSLAAATGGPLGDGLEWLTDEDVDAFLAGR